MSLRLPELALESLTRGQELAQPLALSRAEGRREFLCAVSPEARRQGVRPGQSVTAARAVCAGLEVRPRDEARERAQLEALALIMQRFSPELVIDRLGSGSALLIEIGRSLVHFDGEAGLLARVEDLLARLGHDYRIVIAPRAAAASLLSRLPAPRVRSIGATALDQALDRAPWLILEPEPAILGPLDLLGLETLGDLRRLPRAGLRARFGDELAQGLALAYGEIPADLPRFRPPDRFRQRIDWWPPTRRSSSLLFAAKRLFDLLESWLEGRSTGLIFGRLDFVPADRRIAPMAMALRPRRALREAKALVDLLGHKLERLRLDAEIDRLELRVEAERSLLPEQGLLFAEDHETCWNREAIGLIDRLAHRLGESRVLSPRLEADHRPERAYSWRRAGLDEDEDLPDPPRGRRPLDLEERPLRLELECDDLGHPRRLAAGREPGPLRCLAGPERLASGWWDGQDIVRDYYVVETVTGARWWIFQDRTSGFWYRHGLFS
ncbi:MAG: DNA polymerase Y family protein [Planctomycetes bacterium]|nr:DNA polymerase Y family protein [Planctomycetota bacterium]